jgi:6,7-dimethyl-8-ribityllumazine synthase
MKTITTIEGKLQAEGLTFALIASRFNDFIVNRLIDGATDFLVRHGADKDNLTLIRVPGAFEISKIASSLAHSKKYDGIICLGAIIRGATPHFDLLANETIKGLAKIDLEHNTPIGFGIITADTLEQAIERAGSKAGNKGEMAASACLEMVRVMKQIT